MAHRSSARDKRRDRGTSEEVGYRSGTRPRLKGLGERWSKSEAPGERSGTMHIVEGVAHQETSEPGAILNPRPTQIQVQSVLRLCIVVARMEMHYLQPFRGIVAGLSGEWSDLASAAWRRVSSVRLA
jgi:hypothetical protein